MRKLFFLFAALMLTAMSAAAAPRFYTSVDKLTLSGNMPMVKQLTVYGDEIAGDVTMTLPDGVTATPATISGSDLSIAEGVDIKFVFDTAADFAGEIAFNVPGLDESVKVEIASQNVRVPVKVATLAEFLTLGSGTFAMYTGDAVVTATKNRGDGTVQLFWMQDETAGVRVNTTSVYYSGLPTNVAIGDKLTDVMLNKGDSEQQLGSNGLGENRTLAVVSHDNEVTPKVVATLDELTNAVHDMLIEVKSIKFAKSFDPFAANKVYAITGGAIDMLAQPFSALFGQEVPTEYVDVTGVYTRPDPINLAESLVIRPRTDADIVPSTEIIPTALVSQLSVLKNPVKMGENTIIASYKVVVANLKEEGKITFSGDNASFFSSTPATIGTADGTTEVQITIKATETGQFDTTVKFDFGNDMINKEFNISASVYDPENLPSVTLSEDKVNMYAPVGESATKTITMTMANCVEPVEVTAKDPENTTVTLDKMSFEPTDEPVELTLTFTPTQEGDGIQMFEFKTPMIKTVMVLVVNTTTKEGSVEVLTSDSEGVFHVYNAAGVLVMKTKDAAALKSLTPGLYIVNGRKYMLR